MEFLDPQEPENGFKNGEFTKAQTTRSRQLVPRSRDRARAPAALAAGALPTTQRRCRHAARLSRLAGRRSRPGGQPPSSVRPAPPNWPRTTPSGNGRVAACWIDAAAAGGERNGRSYCGAVAESGSAVVTGHGLTGIAELDHTLPSVSGLAASMASWEQEFGPMPTAIGLEIHM